MLVTFRLVLFFCHCCYYPILYTNECTDTSVRTGCFKSATDQDQNKKIGVGQKPLRTIMLLEILAAVKKKKKKGDGP